MNNRPSKTAAQDCDGSDTCAATDHLLGCCAAAYPINSTEPIYAAQHAEPIRTNAPKPTIYVAGPMSGHQDFNYAAFHYATADLRAAGYTVLNPADTPKPNPDPTWQDWMRAAIGQLIQADGIALLPGWDSSAGAMVEYQLGRGLNLDVRPIMHWLPDEHQNFTLYAPSASSRTAPAFTGPGYEAHPGHDHEDCCK